MPKGDIVGSTLNKKNPIRKKLHLLLTSIRLFSWMNCCFGKLLR